MKMKLSQKRIEFTRMVCLLSAHIQADGFYYHCFNEIKREPTFCGVCKRETTHGHKNSLHRLGLAVDLILYDHDLRYITADQPYYRYHDFWDILGGAERILNDLNHFAYPHDGML